MKSACLIDTNVLVYAYDNSCPEKQHKAIDVLDRLTETSTGAITSQILAEFYVVATQRIPDPLLPEEAEARLFGLCSSLAVYDITPAVVFEAARSVREHGLSYWDAQVWAAAKLNQIPIVLTEDIPRERSNRSRTFPQSFLRELRHLCPSGLSRYANDFYIFQYFRTKSRVFFTPSI